MQKQQRKTRIRKQKKITITKKCQSNKIEMKNQARKLMMMIVQIKVVKQLWWFVVE